MKLIKDEKNGKKNMEIKMQREKFERMVDDIVKRKVEK